MLESYKLLKNFFSEDLIILAMNISLDMDVYFLLRYLSSYDTSKPKGPLNCRDTNISKYSIVVTGFHHTEIYKNFLRLYYMQVPKIDLEDFMAPKRQ